MAIGLEFGLNIDQMILEKKVKSNLKSKKKRILKPEANQIIIKAKNIRLVDSIDPLTLPQNE